MRGKIVYGYTDEEGNVLTWFGRDPDYEEKHRRWEATDKSETEPEKFHFVKGFHRGVELFGQNGRDRLQRPGYREKLKEFGLIVVEGPNDVIALDCLGIPSVALCSNTITDEQADKIAAWANELAGGVVTLMLDCEHRDTFAKRDIIQKRPAEVALCVEVDEQDALLTFLGDRREDPRRVGLPDAALEVQDGQNVGGAVAVGHQGEA
jgi:hypothetical protein